MFMFGFAAILFAVAMVLIAIRGVSREYHQYVLLKLHYTHACDDRVLPTMVELQKADRPVVFKNVPRGPSHRGSLDDTT